MLCLSVLGIIHHLYQPIEYHCIEVIVTFSEGSFLKFFSVVNAYNVLRTRLSTIPNLFGSQAARKADATGIPTRFKRVRIDTAKSGASIYLSAAIAAILVIN